MSEDASTTAVSEAPPAAAPTPAAPAPSGDNSWYDAAASAAPAPTASAVSPATAGTPEAGPTLKTRPEGYQPPNAGEAPAYTATPVQGPAAVQPVRRSGLGGLVDEIRDALAGKTSAHVYTDQDGNKFIRQDTMSHGQQWLRIAANAIRGAGAGMVAGKGTGGAGAALAAGIEKGAQISTDRQKQEKQLSAQVQQENLNRYNMIKVKHEAAAKEFELTRMKVGATEHDVQFSQSQLEREKALGSIDLGTYGDAWKLADVAKDHPDFWKDVYANRIVAVPELGPNGERRGNHIFLRADGVGKQIAPAGTKAHFFVPPAKPGDPPTIIERELSDPTPQERIDQINATAQTQYQAWQLNDSKLKEQQAGTKLKEEEAKNQPSVRQKNQAQAGEATAKAGEATAKTKQIEEQGNNEQLINQIGTGKMAIDRLSYMLARKPELLSAVSAKYPDFDSSKVASYIHAYKDFTSGKTSTQLNSGGTALAHLQELMALNTAKSHIYKTNDWNAYQNKADTVASELAKFYGDATIPAIAAIKSTLTSVIPGNREAAIRTQAQSMGDKLDSYEQQWKNAAPSKSYQAAMPRISQKAMDARAALDPKYKERRVKELQPQPTPPQQAPPAAGAKITIQPGEPTATAPDGKSTMVVRNGQWVIAQP